MYYSPDEPLAPQKGPPNLLREILSAPDLRTVYASNTIELFPATDDRPFFNEPVRWSSLRPYMFKRVLREGSQGVDIQPVAQVTLSVLFVQAVIVAAFLILLPLARLSQQGLRAPHKWSFLTYFAGLGLGFIMIEIVFLQRFSLFLGEPVYTFAVVLASLLIFTGIGSFLTARFRGGRSWILTATMLAIVAVLLVTTIAMPWAFSATLGLSLSWHIAIATALIAPLAILLGMPFPMGLRIVAEESPTLVPWAWGVNGFCTVIGSVGAMILGMAFGFNVVLAVAGGCYIAALVAMMMPRFGMLLLRGGLRRPNTERINSNMSGPRGSDDIGWVVEGVDHVNELKSKRAVVCLSSDRERISNMFPPSASLGCRQHKPPV